MVSVAAWAICKAQSIPKDTIHFSNIQGSVPTGCAVDYKPFADNGMFYVASGKNILNFVLNDTSVDDDKPGKYSLAWSLLGVTPKVGSTYPLIFKPGQGVLEYNCYLTQPISIWVVKDGQLKINSINGTSISFTFSAQMVPGKLNKKSTATFTLQFDGTTHYMSGVPSK